VSWETRGMMVQDVEMIEGKEAIIEGEEPSETTTTEMIVMRDKETETIGKIEEKKVKIGQKEGKEVKTTGIRGEKKMKAVIDAQDVKEMKNEKDVPEKDKEEKMK